MSNLIEINVLILLLFLGYLGIRKGLTFVQQRAVLVGLPFLAVLTVLVKSVIDFSDFSYAFPLVELDQVILEGDVLAQATNQSVPWSSIYLMGTICFGLLFSYRLIRVFLFFLLNRSEKVESYRVYKVSGKSSFSFFNCIQITPSLSAEEQEIVLEHEKMHVNKKHSVDTILMELLHIVFWFNPVFFFLKRRLIDLHEFEVDAVMYKKHDVSYMKFLVSFAFGLTNSNYLLTSRFHNELTLKKRIKTMKTNYKKRSWTQVVLPLVAMAFFLVQCTKQEVDTGDVSSLETNNSELQETTEDDAAEYFRKLQGEEGGASVSLIDMRNQQDNNGSNEPVKVDLSVTDNGEILMNFIDGDEDLLIGN